MNFGALLAALMPLLSNFLKGKSGDELSTLLENNQGVLAGLGSTGGGSSDGALSALALLLPLLMKQNSVFVMGQSGVNPNVFIPASITPNVPSELPPPVELTKVIEKLEARIDLLEKKNK